MRQRQLGGTLERHCEGGAHCIGGTSELTGEGACVPVEAGGPAYASGKTARKKGLEQPLIRAIHSSGATGVGIAIKVAAARR